MKEIRTYMPYNYPIDPAKITIIPDMDLSYALASTLVEWSPAKQITAGLAESWSTPEPKVYRFKLREGAKWSDGSLLTSNDVKQSLERGIKAYPDDLRSLAILIDHIECPNATTIDFHLKMGTGHSNLLGKLTEPNYGIVKISANGALDLSATTGAFFLASASANELTLERNSNWHHFSPSVAERVTIRRPGASVESQSVLLSDPWPNLIETSSLLPDKLLREYESKAYQVWRRPIDKVFVLELGGRLRNQEGYSLLQFLCSKIDRALITNGLIGFTNTDQLFPKGFQLHDLNFRCGDSLSQSQTYKRKLDVLISPARVSAQLKENLKVALTAATGVEPNFISLPLSDAFKRREKGDFDLYAGTYGIADPDPEGIMSFYFESTTPVIPSQNSNFIKRLDEARQEKDPNHRITAMRKIVGDAVCAGHLLPLFHVSTIGLGTKELDFSSVPSSDESVTLSKVRFK